MSEVVAQLKIWGWSSIGPLTDDQWRSERSKDDHHPLGHKLWDGTIDDVGSYEIWHGENLVSTPFWWVLNCAWKLILLGLAPED